MRSVLVSGRTRFVNFFDPWNSRLCSCPLKFNLNPYTGCGHGCVYCYARTYIRDFDRPRPKKGLVKGCLNDLSRLPKGALIALSNSSDPYTPPEGTLCLTRKVLKVLVENGYRILITTKSDLVLRDADILQEGNAVVSITVTTIHDSLSKVMEPGAPPVSRRVKALGELASRRIPVTARIDPIIPYVNDSPSMLKELVRELANAGVMHVTASTLKVRPDILGRVCRAFPEVADKLRAIYSTGEKLKAYTYLPRDLRLRYLMILKEYCEGEGLSFATCREYLNISTPGVSCDGSSYIAANSL